ncbi:hypothetical protein QJS10_CPB14g00327 [Acorus calamus]|uniref:Uncharacterized protein n=1 Tax=Acorus calamus TaxID=4465 RepID=A0AAV9DBL5_ACOCL|nr:hypothetical protein QJS10_CPB14g00327 [Acorus calamus]
MQTESEINKRPRFDDESDESPDAKRFRSELLDILSDDDASSVSDDGEAPPSAASTDDLANVMRLLEEEISLPPPPPPDPSTSDPRDDLGFLLEASDDELGLPPAAAEGGEEVRESVVGDLMKDQVETVGFGQIWGFDDEIVSYDALGVNSDDNSNDSNNNEGSVFFEELFDYADALSGPSDFSDFYWRPESLPAV